MIDAISARKITREVQRKIIEEAKNRIVRNPSDGWSFLEAQINKSAYYEISHHETLILEAFADNVYWHKENIYTQLLALGYDVNFSYSTNPANERWTIKWERSEPT